MNDEPTLGKVIRERRRELGLSQEELAERIGDGVRQAEVSRLERGGVTLPRRQRLERIAAALDLPLGVLLARSGWAGIDTLPPTAAERPPPAAPDAVVLPATVRLRDAIARSTELRRRTAELLARSDRAARDWQTQDQRRSPDPPDEPAAH